MFGYVLTLPMYESEYRSCTAGDEEIKVQYKTHEDPSK